MSTKPTELEDASEGDPDDAPPAENPALTYAATVVDELVRHGVRHAVVAPGSRSTPLALACATHPLLGVEVCHDERVAGFVALGIGKATGRPAVVVTTSGTAAVELHPAIVEADASGVPLLALTADRPPELQGVGAPQTIDQRDLYGRSVRWFADPGPPDVARRDTWRHLAADAYAAATGVVAGPVHLNMAFREPLVGVAGPLDPSMPDHDRPRPEGWGIADEQVARVARAVEATRGVIVAGWGATADGSDALAVAELADVLGWPILADHPSGCRGASDRVVGPFDPLLRVEHLAAELRPEAVIRFGGPVASRVTAEWLAASGAVQFGFSRHGRAPDPDGVLEESFHADTGLAARALCTALERRGHPRAVDWPQRWAELATVAQRAIDAVLVGTPEMAEPSVARAALGAASPGGVLVASSSMPIRDLEWYVPGRSGVTVLANRGANGIDGVMSTAVGVALSGTPTVALVGDLAFLYDANALVRLPRRGVDLAIVVVHNDGGGIFSFLPQASSLEQPRFEQLFGTPHGVDLVALAAAHGVAATAVGTLAGLNSALVGWRERRGSQVIVATSDRARNVELHRLLNAAVAAAVAG